MTAMTTTRTLSFPLHERWQRERWNAASCSAAAASGDPSLRKRLTECAPHVCHDDFSARQGVEDDDMNILCLGGRTTGMLCLELREEFPCREVHRSRSAPPSSC